MTHSNSIYRLVWFFEIILVAVCLGSLSIETAAQNGIDPVVARVAGNPIFLSEIWHSDDVILRGLRMAETMGLRTQEFSPDSGSILNLQTERAISLLVHRIRQIVYSQKLLEHAIVATEEEVERKLHEIHGTSSPDSLRRIAESLYDQVVMLELALRKVYDSGEPPESVYAQLLEGKMSLRSWQVSQIEYENPDRRGRLRERMAIGPAGMDAFEDNARTWVLYDNLNAIIDAELAEKYKEYREFLEHREQGEWPEKYSLNYDDLMREEWWREQYRKADIEILDDRFEDALRLLFGETE